MKKSILCKNIICVCWSFLYIYLHIQVANHVTSPNLAMYHFQPHQTALYHSLNTQAFPHMAIFCVYIISLLSFLR